MYHNAIYHDAIYSSSQFKALLSSIPMIFVQDFIQRRQRHGVPCPYIRLGPSTQTCHESLQPGSVAEPGLLKDFSLGWVLYPSAIIIGDLKIKFLAQWGHRREQ